jgi:hypothetical protein
MPEPVQLPLTPRYDHYDTEEPHEGGGGEGYGFVGAMLATAVPTPLASPRRSTYSPDELRR